MRARSMRFVCYMCAWRAAHARACAATSRYVRAVGARLVAARLAPYLADVLLVLDFNDFFEKG
jgi:hypothetical protein